MANTNLLENLLQDRDCSIPSILEEVRKFQVHEINTKRSTFGEYHHLFPILKKYPDKFKSYLRMEVATFNYILSKVERSLLKNWCNLHPQPILPEEQLVISIRFLVTGMSYNDMSFTFRMGASTICTTTSKVMEVVWENLYRIHMPVPTEENLSEIAKEFYSTWNFPHCLGAIDVRHIAIQKPPKTESMYYNYKKFFSITLQGVVDANYKFISIDVGGYGRQHDASTFRSSKFYAALQRNIVKIPKTDQLPNSTVTAPYFFIGDGAYPLMQHLLKPYPGLNLSISQCVFNKRLSRARLVVECAFGKLCQKWQIFYKTMQCLPTKAVLITKYACLLHNVIIDFEEKHNDYSNIQKEVKTLPKIVVNGQQDNFPVGLGKEVREMIREFVTQNPI